MRATVMPGSAVFVGRESGVRSYCRNFDSVFDTARGSLVRDIEGREYIDVIAFTNGFHGVTAGALAAVILETVQGEGGLDVASPGWLRRVADIAQRHGALLVVDDVQAGCGRTGTFFSTEVSGVEPDLIALSKSISGFGLPMALLLIKPQWDQWAPGEHYGTFRGNAHAFVSARVALEKFWGDTAFERDIARSGALVAARLGRIAGLIPGARVKGRGMMRGVDVGLDILEESVSANQHALVA